MVPVLVAGPFRAVAFPAVAFPAFFAEDCLAGVPRVVGATVVAVARFVVFLAPDALAVVRFFAADPRFLEAFALAAFARDALDERPTSGTRSASFPSLSPT